MALTPLQKKSVAHCHKTLSDISTYSLGIAVMRKELERLKIPEPERELIMIAYGKTLDNLFVPVREVQQWLSALTNDNPE